VDSLGHRAAPRAATLAGLLLGAAGHVAAQAPGLPIYGAGMSPGLELSATGGWAGSSSMTGKATSFGATAAYRWSRVGLSGTAGYLDGDLGNKATFGALANLRLLGGGVDTPFEVGILGGYGGTSGSHGGNPSWHAPAGVGFSLTIATPVVSIRPWLAPRAEFFSTEESGTRETVTRFAGSAGVDLRFVGGFGLRVLWDKVDGYDQTIGAGLAYRF